MGWLNEPSLIVFYVGKGCISNSINSIDYCLYFYTSNVVIFSSILTRLAGFSSCLLHELFGLFKSCALMLFATGLLVSLYFQRPFSAQYGLHAGNPLPFSVTYSKASVILNDQALLSMVISKNSFSCNSNF